MESHSAAIAHVDLDYFLCPSGTAQAAPVAREAHGCDLEGQNVHWCWLQSSRQMVLHWLKELAETLQLRLDEDLSQNNRAHLLTIHASYHIEGRAPKFSSKSWPLRYGVDKIIEDKQ
ncbi:hypothetical protein SELMODRAFT_409880 [Selaginella moellendorffii]|uniref:Uncharacterized protein n=1 Tax=Selaginella moellendorffii TaxID=88036 RepID=D8RCS0_SELML|nr:hypothetical protein SELMODRAFT_409880 [Selaginella moellendorffii]